MTTNPTFAVPCKVRVVLVASWEPAGGGGPGELGLWVEREALTARLAFPGGPQPLWANADGSLLAMASGSGTASAAASLLALGLDPRFDLSQTYFLLTGVAGIDPAAGPVGSVAWARFVVGDIAREVSPLEAPTDWTCGLFPVGAASPQPPSVAAIPWMRPNLFTLNARLARWAFEVSGNAASQPETVLEGDVLASNRIWHGARLTQFARDWMGLHTAGRGVFTMASMEDAGYLLAVERLAAMGRVDPARVMLLRGASNATMPPAGEDAVASATAPLAGFGRAVESLWRAGSPVVRRLLQHGDPLAESSPAG